MMHPSLVRMYQGAEHLYGNVHTLQNLDFWKGNVASKYQIEIERNLRGFYEHDKRRTLIWRCFRLSFNATITTMERLIW